MQALRMMSFSVKCLVECYSLDSLHGASMNAEVSITIRDGE